MRHLFTSYSSLIRLVIAGDVSYDQLMEGLFFFGCERLAVEEAARQPITLPSMPPPAPGQPADTTYETRRVQDRLKHNASVLVAVAIELAARPGMPAPSRCAFRKPRGTEREMWNRLWCLLVPHVEGLQSKAWVERTDVDCTPSSIVAVLEDVEVIVHQ